MKTVTVANYGIGNLLSVQRALAYCGAEVEIATTPEQILKAERLVVPGVGAFKRCMEALESHHMTEALLRFAQSGRPYLGICVGMQMLMERSFEFGTHQGLGLIKGDVKKIEIPGYTVPFIGWKSVNLLSQPEKYYFVHSYCANPLNQQNLIASYRLGTTQIAAAVRSENVLGVQFHPEKSGEAGIKFLQTFIHS